MSNLDALYADKSIGNRISIKFTENLTGDVSGYSPYPLNQGKYINPIGVASASSQNSISYIPSYAFDGTTSDMWRSATESTPYLQIDLGSNIWTSGFGWYCSSYYATSYKVQGSYDGIDWVDIYTDSHNSSYNSYTKAGTWTSVNYRYYRWQCLVLYSSYWGIYYIKLLTCLGNEASFTITGQEYQYVGGPLLTKTYNLVNCDVRYPSILQEIDLGTGTLNGLVINSSGLGLGKET